MKYSRRLSLATTVSIGLLAITACSTSDPFDENTTAEGNDTTIVVGSANYSENVILGELYSQALEGAGFNVERQLNIGAREVLYWQVADCSLDVVPEYNQALLAFVDADQEASGTEEVNAALTNVLPSSLEILESSEAQNNNAVAVTQETAEQHNLETIPDLADVAGEMSFGGPTEWKTRSDGYAGLQEDYDVNFEDYQILDYSGPITLTALNDGAVDVALLFSTTPQIETEGYVILDDPQNTIGVNNITPLICSEAMPDEAKDVLNDISMALDTEKITNLNARYVLDHVDVEEVVSDWLEGEGL